MNTKKRNRLQKWQAVYHLGVVGGVPNDVIHVHDDQFDHLKDGESYIKDNPIPPDDALNPRRIKAEEVMVSLVQVRGPFHAVQETALKPIG